MNTLKRRISREYSVTVGRLGRDIIVRARILHWNVNTRTFLYLFFFLNLVLFFFLLRLDELISAWVRRRTVFRTGFVYAIKMNYYGIYRHKYHLYACFHYYTVVMSPRTVSFPRDARVQTLPSDFICLLLLFSAACRITRVIFLDNAYTSIR